MKTNEKTDLFLILLLLLSIFMLAGCSALDKPAAVAPKPDSNQQQSNATPKRFQDSAPKDQTAVDSAIELSHKYAKLSEEITELRGKKQDLITENRQLKERLAILEPELEQAKKELNEANDLLIDMTTELNNWKTNILGFRDELRDADKAQLEALLRILKVLGGEVKPASGEAEQTEVSQEQGQGSTTVSLNKQSKLLSKKINISSESNE